MSSDYRPKPKPRRNGMWPVIGLVLAVALGAISWVAAPYAYNLIRQRAPQFSIGTFTEQQVTIGVGVVIFLLLAALAVMIVAAFAPRKKGRADTRDAKLRKEKETMLREEKERKVRKRSVEQKIRSENRERAKKLTADRKKAEGESGKS